MDTMDGASAALVPDSRDLKAFEVLVREHHRSVLAYARTLTQRADLAEDLSQDAFLVAYQRLGDFDATRDFGAWVRGIVRLKHLESLRGAGRQCPLSDRLLDDVEAEFARWQLAHRETGEDVLATLRDCVSRLQEVARRTVDRFYADRAACAEIASELGTSEAVIRKRLQRAREVLHGCMELKLGRLRAATGTP
jgi:RNA polymerase sigma-70 factor (ECF subfamily)